MKRIASALMLGLAFLQGCDKAQPETTSSSELSTKWHDEGKNLVALHEGAVIVDRSGELGFENAALLAIDGHPGTTWSSPPRDLEQWIIVALPVRTRIEKVGLYNGALVVLPRLAGQVRFEVSDDGLAFEDLGVFSFESNHDLQFRDVSASEARFLRVTMLTNHGSPVVTDIPSILIEGEEVDEYVRPSAAGHWKLNNLEADLREDGTRVYGRVLMDPPMLIEGAWHNRLVRFTWTRGKTFGVGMMAVSPDGESLNGLWWYENFVEPGTSFGTPWYGSRTGESDEFQLTTSQVAQVHVERDGRFPLFGLIFNGDGRLDAKASEPAIRFIKTALEAFPDFRVRLVVNEFHSRDPGENMARSAQFAAGLEDGLVAVGVPRERLAINAYGSERQVPWRSAPIHWEMYSRVDFALTTVD